MDILADIIFVAGLVVALYTGFATAALRREVSVLAARAPRSTPSSTARGDGCSIIIILEDAHCITIVADASVVSSERNGGTEHADP